LKIVSPRAVCDAFVGYDAMRHLVVLDAILKVIKPSISHFYAVGRDRHHPAIGNDRKPIPAPGSGLIANAD
jgi:hypothetical protein